MMNRMQWHYQVMASFDAAWSYSGHAEPVGDDYAEISDLAPGLQTVAEHVADMYRMSGMVG